MKPPQATGPAFLGHLQDRQVVIVYPTHRIVVVLPVQDGVVRDRRTPELLLPCVRRQTAILPAVGLDQLGAVHQLPRGGRAPVPMPVDRRRRGIHGSPDAVPIGLDDLVAAVGVPEVEQHHHSGWQAGQLAEHAPHARDVRAPVGSPGDDRFLQPTDPHLVKVFVLDRPRQARRERHDLPELLFGRSATRDDLSRPPFQIRPARLSTRWTSHRVSAIQVGSGLRAQAHHLLRQHTVHRSGRMAIVLEHELIGAAELARPLIP